MGTLRHLRNRAGARESVRITDSNLAGGGTLVLVALLLLGRLFVTRTTMASRHAGTRPAQQPGDPQIDRAVVPAEAGAATWTVVSLCGGAYHHTILIFVADTIGYAEPVGAEDKDGRSKEEDACQKVAEPRHIRELLHANGTAGSVSTQGHQYDGGRVEAHGDGDVVRGVGVLLR